MAVVEHNFRVMASAAQLVLVDPAPGAVAHAEQRLAGLEEVWSRFLPESDVSRIARDAGQAVPVTPETCVLVEAMVRAHDLTDGKYDPTMLHEIVATGYGASIDDTHRLSITIDLPSIGATIADVDVDLAEGTITLPPGMGLDPGGVGKGLAADTVCQELLATGTAGVLVNIGGDLACGGEPPDRAGWVVTVDDPNHAGNDIVTLAVSGGGVATSSTQSRQWTVGGRHRHHILDPRTRTTARSGLASVTVFASAAWLAETYATAALLEGDGAIAYLEHHTLSGVVVAGDGSRRHTSDLAASLEYAGAR